ncbi:MAG: FHA domain-containing protein [Phenylobacterium sp.]|uniref:cytochrome c3 family protein n=1 Tax=Phenylobacterium sp. TaxID=1871053 RepID=UPI001222F1F2|nr:cytochrome c3 family protein [Phenylobacterium sp.]TAJ73962.1 MAG: FHA domain-containing protein [Phenylobacterium sp.]
MAQEFHLKLITQRSGGGDPIVRERRLEGLEATIGRAPDNDIVLADLSIDPQHARMRFIGPGRIGIESVSGLPFRVAGKSVQSAVVDAAGHPVVAFGEYTLSFAPGEEAEAVEVTVTREDDEHHASPGVFSLQAKVFGRRNMAWVLGSGIFLLCLAIPMIFVLFMANPKIHPDQQWSTGPLSKAHAFMEKDCKSCHANAFVAVRDEACLTCHTADPATAPKALDAARRLGSPFEPRLVAEHAAHADLEKATPLPPGFGRKVSVMVQRTLNHPTDRCASCHVEHTPAKGGDPTAPLSDKPKLVVVQDCESCHSQLKMRLAKTDLIDTPDWSKHPGFRALVMTQAGPKPSFQRVALDTAPQERNGLIFPHRLHLDPLGGVARQAIGLGKAAGYGAALECASCHRRDASGTSFLPIEMERDCADCHSLAYAKVGGELRDLPHGDLDKVVATLAGRTVSASGGSDRTRPGQIRPTAFAASGASAYRATFSRGGACYDCHTITWDGDTVRMAPVKLAAKYLPRGGFDHGVPEHGGPGLAKKGGFKCADCHRAQTSDKSGDVLIPDLAKCGTCHGQTTAKIAAADDADCTTCHSFHKPGQATPKPGHPPLRTLRWTEAITRREAGA